MINIKKYNVIDLFCGAGGFSYGFHLANFNILLGLDYNTLAIKTYYENFKKLSTNIARLSEKDLLNNIFTSSSNKIYDLCDNSKIDVIIGSPPCQKSSKNNSRKNELRFFPDFLTREYFRMVLLLEPTFFVLENVHEFFTRKENRFFDVFIPFLEFKGYTLQFFNLDCSEYGLPQKRKRVFIIGNTIKAKINLDKYKSTKISIKDAIDDLNFTNYTEGISYLTEPQTNYQRIMRNGSNKLYNHIAPNHTSKIKDKMNEIKSKPIEEKYISYGNHSNSKRMAHPNEPYCTLCTRLQINNSHFHYDQLRCITCREAARIQSFPDSFIFYGSKDNISEQIGNAVPPLISNIIATEIFNCLEK